MTDEYGYKVVRWSHRSSPYRVKQWLPSRGEKCFRLVKGDIWVIVHWQPRGGLWVRSGGRASLSNTVPLWRIPRPQEKVMKRRSPPTPGVVIVPAIPASSTLWPKLPATRAFLHDTQYEDNSPRTPGYLTVRNKVSSMEVTFYDPDSGCRLPVRGRTLDEALTLGEQLLGVEEAPWEPDNYLMSELVRKGKKRK